MKLSCSSRRWLLEGQSRNTSRPFAFWPKFVTPAPDRKTLKGCIKMPHTQDFFLDAKFLFLPGKEIVLPLPTRKIYKIVVRVHPVPLRTKSFKSVCVNWLAKKTITLCWSSLSCNKPHRINSVCGLSLQLMNDQSKRRPPFKWQLWAKNEWMSLQRSVSHSEPLFRIHYLLQWQKLVFLLVRRR